MRTLLPAFLLALGLAWGPAQATSSPPPRYQLTDLGTAGGYTQSFSYGLSDNGAYVAGWVASGSATRAFRWSAGHGMELLALDGGATASRGFGVNDSGTVAGESVLATHRIATLWAAGGARSELGTLPNPASANFSSVAFGVNNAGVAAGWSDSVDSTRAFRWTTDTGMASLGTLQGGTQTRAYGITADGSIVGWGTSPAGDRGFVAGTGLSSVGALSDVSGSRTRAFGASNDNGWITGDASDPQQGETAFLWSQGSGLIALGRLPGALRSYGADVNSAAAVVGWNEGGAGGEEGFLWTEQTGMLSFNSLVVDGATWRIQRARAINDLGYVVANALDGDGRVHAVLLTPVPEPAAGVLMAAGLATLLAWRRRAAAGGSAAQRRGR